MKRHVRLVTLMALLVLVPAMAAAAGGFAYVTNSGSGTISVIDLGSHTQVEVIGLPGSAVPYGVALSPDRKTLYATNFGNGTVYRVDLETKAVTPLSAPAGTYGVAVHPEGKYVYVTHNTRAGGVSIFDTATFARTSVASGSMSAGVAVNAARGHLYVANSRGFSVFELGTHAFVRQVDLGAQAWGVAVHPQGQAVYVTMPGTSELAVVDAATLSVTARIPTGGIMPVSAAVSPDGRWVYVTNHGSATVAAIDAVTNTRVALISVGSMPFGMQFTPDGSRAYVMNFGSHSISVIDVATHRVATVTAFSGSAPVAFGLFMAGDTAIAVAIDIMPGGNPNTINLRARGALPVAILGSADFSVADIDVSTVRLAGAPVLVRGNGQPMASVEDVNTDGFLDLVVHIDREALALTPADTEAVLEGKTHDGRTFRGKDAVRVVR